MIIMESIVLTFIPSYLVGIFTGYIIGYYVYKEINVNNRKEHRSYTRCSECERRIYSSTPPPIMPSFKLFLQGNDGDTIPSETTKISSTSNDVEDNVVHRVAISSEGSFQADLNYDIITTSSFNEN